MLLLRCNRNIRGMGLVEVIIAVFLTSIAIMAIFSLMAPGWRTVARADFMGRATEILQRQLEGSEAYIMDAGNSAAIAGLPALPGVGATTAPTAYNVVTSGFGAAQTGDVNFTVTTTIAGISTNLYRVLVNVSWPANPTGVSQTIYVSRQTYF